MLVARIGDEAVGCVVVTAAVDGRAEVKRLWTDPAFRGRGVASELINAALAHCAENGVSTVRLSVWTWRTAAIALYERLGFTVTESWDGRDQLVCMVRAVEAAMNSRRNPAAALSMLSSGGSMALVSDV